MIKGLIERRRIRKENEFLSKLPRFIKVNEDGVCHVYDTSRYFVNYFHKYKVLKLKSKKTGRTVVIETKNIK